MTTLSRSIALLCSLVALALSLAGSPARAEEVAASAVPVASNAIAPVTDAWRAALPQDPEAATQAYLARLSPQARARSDAYFEGGYRLSLWNVLLTLAISWVLLQTRPAQAARRWCERLGKRRFVQVLAYGAFFVLASWLLSLPLTIYQGFVREHAYGMATQTFAAWFGEQLMSLGVALLIGPLFVLALYTVIRRFPRHWWLGATVVAMGFMVALLMLAPVYIEPLFNTYKPLADTPVKQSILAMAHANGVPASNVYEFDASRQTTRVSANVSGLWGTASVRLNDNLLHKSSDPEILAVVGHEIGHFAMNHIAVSLVEFGLVIAAALAFVAWASTALSSRYGERWQLASVQDVGSLPLLAAVFSVVMLFATPVTNTITRTMEVEADLYGLNLAREPDGEAEALLKLVEYRKAEPGPLEEMVFFDHPSAHTRIYNAMRWKAQMQPKP